MSKEKAADIGGDGAPQTNDVPPLLERRFEIYPLAAMKLEKGCDYLIKGLLQAADLCVLYGPPGVGKSFLALDAALHVAAGREWAGCRVRSNGRGVIYVASEGARGFRRRIIAAIEHRGFGTDIPFALIEDAPDLGDDKDLACLIKAIEDQSVTLGFRPSLIVLDTLARSMVQLNESDSSSMATFISNAKRIADVFGCLVMPIHHSGKDLERGMRGSSALQGAADAIWCLKVEDGTNTIELQKMKDGPSGAVRSFKLERYPLGLDADGDAMETQVVGDIAEPAAAKPRKPSVPAVCEPDDADRSLEMIRKILTEGQTGKARATGLPNDMPALSRKPLKRTLAALIKADRPELKDRSEFTLADRYLKKLLGRGSLSSAGNWIWLTPDRPAVTPAGLGDHVTAAPDPGPSAEDAPMADPAPASPCSDRKHAIRRKAAAMPRTGPRAKASKEGRSPGMPDPTPTAEAA